MKSFIQNKNTDGFTLVEFIVIMSIFAIMVGVALFNFSGFRSNVITENLAHDIAITLRNIQVGGGASQSVLDGDPSAEQYRGAYFDLGSNCGREIILFIDNNEQNFEYDLEEDYDTITIESADYIKDIYSVSRLSDNLQEDLKTATPVTNEISIMFGRFSTRPDFGNYGDMLIENLVIQVGNDTNEDRDRFIVISRLGQIYVQ